MHYAYASGLFLRFCPQNRPQAYICFPIKKIYLKKSLKNSARRQAIPRSGGGESNFFMVPQEPEKEEDNK